MTLLLREAARVENARSFYRDIYNENDFFYIFASRARAWEDDTTPEVPRDSQYYQAQYNEALESYAIEQIGTRRRDEYQDGEVRAQLNVKPPSSN